MASHSLMDLELAASDTRDDVSVRCAGLILDSETWRG